MESVRLFEFYRSVTSWPKTKGELTVLAERLQQLLDAPFAGIHLVTDGERTAVKGAAGAALDSTSPELLEEMIRTQLRRLEECFKGSPSGAPVRQVQVSHESLPLPMPLPISNLAIAPIPRTKVLPEAGTIDPATRPGREPGWIIIGSPKPLSEKEQTLLVAAAQRLSELCAEDRLESALRLRSQFLSIASHELKTPLTSIYGILQLQERMARASRPPEQDERARPTLASAGALEERKQSFLKIVIRQVERLNELIDALLDVSRIQNGRFNVEPAEVDVSAILREALGARLAVIAQEAGVSLSLEGPASLMAFVDPVRIEEVITNLVMNAIRFSPEAGVVSVRLQGENGSFRLTVRDQGPSVPVEDRERIFQPFERAQRTSRLGGLGLGLFISRQIAQLHGGNVSLVESVPGKGNVFEASFPQTVSGTAREGSAASA